MLTPFWGPKHSKFKAPIEYGPVKYGAIAAFKVEEKAGKWTLAPAWLSRDMNRAEPPVIANGVIFAYGNGEDTDQARFDIGLAYNHAPSIASKVRTQAVLYALDAQTGKELWSSGDQIASWSHWGGLSVANGRVYINTFDGMQYCFGIKNGADQTASRSEGEPVMRRLAAVIVVCALCDWRRPGSRARLDDDQWRRAAFVLDQVRHEDFKRQHAKAGIPVSVEDETEESAQTIEFADAASNAGPADRLSRVSHARVSWRAVRTTFSR